MKFKIGDIVNTTDHGFECSEPPDISGNFKGIATTRNSYGGNCSIYDGVIYKDNEYYRIKTRYNYLHGNWITADGLEFVYAQVIDKDKIDNLIENLFNDEKT